MEIGRTRELKLWNESFHEIFPSETKLSFFLKQNEHI